MSEIRLQTSYDSLISSNLMEAHPLNNQFIIGTVAHGEKLKEALSTGKLDTFLKEFADLYRDSYGREPWHEYLCCTNKECKKKQGIPEDVLLSEADEKFRDNPGGFFCDECGSPLELFYPESKTIKKMRDGFKQKIFASLLFTRDDKELSGFSLGWEITVAEGYNDKMIVGSGDQTKPVITYSEYLKELSEVLGKTYPENAKAYNAAEWVTSSRARGAKAALPLLHAVFSTAQKKMADSPGEEIPVIAHTLVESTAFKLVKKIGWATGPRRPETAEIRLYSTLITLMNGIEKIIL